MNVLQMIIQFIGYHDINLVEEVFRHLTSDVQDDLNTLLKYELPFESLLKYFETAKLQEIIAKHTNYRLNYWEFLLQFYISQQRKKAHQRYEYNLLKERKLNPGSYFCGYLIQIENHAD